ncbi:MAG: Rab family GTPase [Thalassotalea sp.]
MIQKKICLLGATGVGKTSLVRQYVSGIFDDKYLTSLGVKIDKKIIETANNSVQFLLWDIEGVDQYSAFNPRYLRGASGVIIVVDKTRKQSFIEGYEIYSAVKSLIECPIILAINKSDLNERFSLNDNIEQQRLFELCFQTSAKTGEQVEEMFIALADLLVK